MQAVIDALPSPHSSGGSPAAPGPNAVQGLPDEAGGPGRRLSGCRILLVEDEFLIAMQIEDALQSFGCEVLGPFTTLERAREAAGTLAFDAALLDINLSGQRVYPVADDLLRRGVPFMFLSGYAGSDILEAYRELPRLGKPFLRPTMERSLRRILGHRD